MQSIVPKSLKKLAYLLSRFPGIGHKTARRLAMHIFSMKSADVKNMSILLQEVKSDIKKCSFCGVYSDTDPCLVCANTQRDHTKLCIVKDSLDVYTLEKSGVYNGLYFVIDVNLENIVLGQDSNIALQDITKRIFKRISQILRNGRSNNIHMQSNNNNINSKTGQNLEIIFAFGTTIEEQTVLMYLKQALSRANFFKNIKLSRLGMGLSSGSSVDFVDAYTLKEAFNGRRDV